MRQERQVLVNAAMSVLQVVVLGAIPIVLYRFLLDIIGIELLGVWSVVLSAVAVTRIADLGLSASVVKFVAKYVARNEIETASDAVQTSVLSIAVFVGLVLLLAYPFSGWLLGLVIPGEQLEAGLSILPCAFVSLFVNMVTSVLHAGFDGCQRVDLRSKILMGMGGAHLFLCFVLTPTCGLMGLAYASVIEAGVTLVVSWLLLRKVLETIPVIPYHWRLGLFREMLGYGVNFQVVSIVNILYEPTTTALLSRFGGLAAVGYYEMARRMIRQTRSLIVSANQVLIPFIADLQEKQPKAVQVLYKDSYRLLVYIALPLYSAIVALTPVISEIWVGHYEGTFVRFSALLAIGWFSNTLSAPAYFANLGLGELRWNTVGHIIIAVLNGGLGLLGGSLYGGIAVVVAGVFSLIVGSFLIIIAYHQEHKMPLGDLLPKESRGIALASVIGLLVALVLYYRFLASERPVTMVAIAILAFVLVVITPVWLHPMRGRLVGWAFHLLRPKIETETG
jgi:O-antigen/teichoic acid export membrane protein